MKKKVSGKRDFAAIRCASLAKDAARFSAVLWDRNRELGLGTAELLHYSLELEKGNAQGNPTLPDPGAVLQNLAGCHAAIVETLNGSGKVIAAVNAWYTGHGRESVTLPALSPLPDECPFAGNIAPDNAETVDAVYEFYVQVSASVSAIAGALLELGRDLEDMGRAVR